MKSSDVTIRHQFESSIFMINIKKQTNVQNLRCL